MKSIQRGDLLSSETRKDGERSQSFDIAKGMLMLLVIFGHSLQFIGYSGRGDLSYSPILGQFPG